MVTGFVLVFVGIQLYLVQSYVLTPRMSNFLSEQANSYGQPRATSPVANAANPNSPFYQASYQTPQQYQLPVGPSVAKQITPPRWLCWPVLFLGAVVLLHGASKPRLL